MGREAELTGFRLCCPRPLVSLQDDDADIQQLEDLLETYFTQVDNSFNKLQARREAEGGALPARCI